MGEWMKLSQFGIASETDLEKMIWVQVVYLGTDPQKTLVGK